MTGAPDRQIEPYRSDEAKAASPPGRTAFDALNPYGDFGGSNVSRRQLVAIALACVVATTSVLAMAGVWVTEALRKPDPTPTAKSSPPAPAAAPTPPVAAAPATPAPAPAPTPAPTPAPAPAPAPSPAPSSSSPSHRPRRSPPAPARFLVVTGVRDRSRADVDGLDTALERGFLDRLRSLAPALPLKVGGRAKTTDLGVRVLLMRLDEASGGGAHDVTARCALASRPKEALPSGPLYAQGKQQGIERSDDLREDAVRRCGERLAEALAPLATEFLN